MSTPTTSSQMKNKIDQDITSNQGVKKSINPTLLGTLLKIVVDWVEVRIASVNTAITNLSSSIGSTISVLAGRVTDLENAELPISPDAGNVLQGRENGLYVPTPEGGGEGQGSVISYPKDDTITEEQIGLLAMHKFVEPTINGDLILSIFPNRFILFVNNITGGSFSENDEITQDSAVANLDGFFEVGGGVFAFFITVSSGTFVLGEIITNGVASADVISAPSNTLEVGQNVILNGNEGNIGTGTVSDVEGNEATIQLVTVTGDINTLNSVLVNVDTFPAVIALVDIENSTFPEIIEGVDVATLCQTSPAIEGTKPEIELRIGGIINETRPTTRIIRISFNGDNIIDNQSITLHELGYGALPLTIMFKDSPENTSQVQIGATLEDTLDNFETWLDGDSLLSEFFAFAGRDGNNSIDIEVLPFTLSTATWTIGSNDGKPFYSYRIPTYFEGDLGDDMGGGYATFSMIRDLENTTLANEIADMASYIIGMINYNDSYVTSFDFLPFLSIYTWEGLTPEEMGFVWFDNGEDFTSAVVSGLENEMEVDFNNVFEIVSSNWDSDIQRAVVRIRRKEPLRRNLNYTFIASSEEYNANRPISFETVVLPTQSIPQCVRNIVLGEIVGIDGDEVLVSSSYTQNVTLAGIGEGFTQNNVNAGVPSNLTEGWSPELIAWDNGKVVESFWLWQWVVDNYGKVNTWDEVFMVIRGFMVQNDGFYMPISSGSSNNPNKNTVQAIKKYNLIIQF